MTTISFGLVFTAQKNWWEKRVFAIGIDTDNIVGSGASNSPLGRVTFSGNYKPDKYFFIGRAPTATATSKSAQNRFQETTWNGTSWDWAPSFETSFLSTSTNSDVFMTQTVNEFSTDLSALNFQDSTARMWLYLVSPPTTPNNIGVAWGMPTGSQVTVGDSDGLIIAVPEPATLALLGISALFVRRRK